MSIMRVDQITDSAGTGSPTFPNGLTLGSNTIVRTDLITNAAGTGSPTFPNGLIVGADSIQNLGLAASVAVNALTLAVKQANGSTDPTATSGVAIGVRSATLSSGAWNNRSVTSALSLVVPSGATLGTASGVASTLFVYLIDNAGTLEMAISKQLFREDSLVSTTAISAGSTSATVMYSTVARTNVAFRLIAKLVETQATAGTWTAVPTQIQLAPFAISKVPTRQVFTSGTTQTYTTPAGCTAIFVKIMSAGGGGGANSTANNGGTGVAGTASIFGTATGGGGAAGTGTNGNTGAAGGTNSSTGTLLNPVSIQGGRGGPAATGNSAYFGGDGGNGFFGGSGPGGSTNTTGSTASANSGAGGGGAGGQTTHQAATGGGSGANMEGLIANPDSTYTYSVGIGGTGGSGGTGSNSNGGAGASGLIIVEEYYI